MRLRHAALCAAAVSAAVVSTTLVALPARPAAATAANTVTGFLKYEDGRPAAGKPITLEAAPLADVPVGTPISPVVIDATVTDALGGYTLTASPTAQFVALAQDNGGVLNATVHAIVEDAPIVAGGGEQDTNIQSVAYGVQFELLSDPTVPGGLQFSGPGTVDLQTRLASVSVNPEGTDATVTAGTAETGRTSVSASPPPDPDPEGDVNQAVDTTVNNVGTVQDGIDAQTGVDTRGVVGVDSYTADTLLDAVANATGTSAIINEIRAYDSGGGGSGDPHRYPSDPCPDDYANISYAMYYTTYVWDDWVTVGELHVPSDTVGSLTFKASKSTSIGFGVWLPGKGWEINGSRKPVKSSSAWNGWRTAGPYGRHIKSKYKFRDVRYYWCKPSSRGQYVAHYEDWREATEWKYSMTQAGNDLRGWDSKSYFDKARAAGRAQSFSKYETPGHSSGDGYNYHWETCIIGVCLGSETDFSTETSLSWDFQGHRSTYWLFGNDAAPLAARITYAYG